ncbi:MAG: hypothetical protein WBA12_13810, partial [Catalinimonas sp.]
INRWLLIAATGAWLMAIPVSISRALFFQGLLTAGFTFLIVARKPKYLGKMLVAVLGLFVALVVLSSVSYFQTALEAFTSRFDTANKVEGGIEGVLMDRYLGGLVKALSSSFDQSFFGKGLGMGTNVGSRLLAGDRNVFLIAEGEWGRVIGEMGPLLGLALVIIRLAVSAKLVLSSYHRVVANDPLAWIILSLALTLIPQSQWGQPTSLGFSTLVGGLLIAAVLHPPTNPSAPTHEDHPDRQLP